LGKPSVEVQRLTDAGDDVFAPPKLQHSVELKIRFREPVIVDFGGKAANS
jgi:hypothetical protein